VYVGVALTGLTAAARLPRVHVGIIIRNSGIDAERQVAELPLLVESLGFNSVWVSDHLTVPDDFAARYDEHWLEATVALACIAASTRRVRLGFSALVLPYRPAPLVASQVATLHEVSGGRVVLGAGSGWLREEFEALGLDFAARGSVTDAALREVRARSSVEILAAGNSARILRRAAELCDGWHPIALTPAEVAAKRAALGALAGRPMRVVLRARFSIGTSDQPRPLYGTPEKIRLDVERYAAAGVDELVLDHAVRTHGEILDSVQRLAAAIELPKGVP
jgi:alkanesulfonate monooxygenase SsuD/methylene tetrahydromethanopterin reductase-like flavin-dependent oxidoreductase (luciferase family)